MKAKKELASIKVSNEALAACKKVKKATGLPIGYFVERAIFEKVKKDKIKIA